MRLRTSSRSVIMIHGFANSSDRARNSYASFVDTVAGTFWPDMPADIVSFFGLQWPGDHPSRIRNVISFPTRIGNATQTGYTLGRYLEAHLSSSKTVVIVAHSLGCRVALACAEYLATWAAPDSGPNVQAVVLLAAAVPVRDAMEPDGQFRLRHAGRYHVHHSRWDVALMLPFTSGNWLYDKAGVAIGRTGGPVGSRWDERLNTRHDHSAYWSAPSSAKAVLDEIHPAATKLLHEVSAEQSRISVPGWELPTSPNEF